MANGKNLAQLDNTISALGEYGMWPNAANLSPITLYQRVWDEVCLWRLYEDNSCLCRTRGRVQATGASASVMMTETSQMKYISRKHVVDGGFVQPNSMPAVNEVGRQQAWQ